MEIVLTTFAKEDIFSFPVANETAKTGPEDSAVLVVSKNAINRQRIEITQVYAPEMPKTELKAPEKKESFWHKLLHGEK